MAEKIKLPPAMWLLVAVLAGLLVKDAESAPEVVQLVSRCSTLQTENGFLGEVYPIPESAITANGKVTFKFQVKAESDVSLNIYPNKTVEDSTFYYEININRDSNRSEILRCPKFKIHCDTVGSTSASFPLSASKRYYFNLNVSPGGYWTVTQDDDRTLLEGNEINPVPMQSFSMHSKPTATWVFNCTEVTDDEGKEENGDGTPEASLKDKLIRRKADDPPQTATIQVDEIKATILSMDDAKKELVAKVHLKLDWTDTRLEWNATDDLTDLTLTTLASTGIWTPEIFQYKTFPQDFATNDAVSLDTQLRKGSVLVSNTGLVKWQLQVTPTLPCDYANSANAASEGKRLVCAIHLGEVDGNRSLQLHGEYTIQKQNVNGKWNIIKATISHEQLKDGLGNHHSALSLQVNLETTES